MAIDASIREKAAQFFIQEAPELLQTIEQELLTLSRERTPQKVHSMMRAAHSIKGGAANIGLETIKTLAHRLEDFFRSLHHEALVIDAELEDLLLRAYDCLRKPLMDVVQRGRLNKSAALRDAEPVFARLDERLAGFGPGELPTMAELGVDMTRSVFEMDVAQGIERLRRVASDPHHPTLEGELRAQAEVFCGLAELLELPGFAAIAHQTLAALDRHPGAAHTVATLALADFERAYHQVMDGDRTRGGEPSAQLATLAGAALPVVDAPPAAPILSPISPATEVPPPAPLAEEALPPPVVSESAAEPLLLPDFPAPDAAIDGSDVSLPGVAPLPLDALFADLSEAEVDAHRAEPLPASLSFDEMFGFVVEATPPVLSPPPPDPVSPVGAAMAEAVPQSSAVEPPADAVPPSPPVPPPVPPVLASASATALEVPPPLVAAQAVEDDEEDVLPGSEAAEAPAARPSVRVDLDRLDRLNNQVGELAIAQNGQALQNERLQATVALLTERLARITDLGSQLRTLSDQMLASQGRSVLTPAWDSGFDALELDRYGQLHLMLQDAVETIAQVEEAAGDVALFAGLSNQSLERQRRMLKHLRDDLMWARMLPLGEILDRFPRALRELSRQWGKPCDLKLTGTHVLVDKAVLEKLYDPILHLVRNAFDHGLEAPEVRRAARKPETGRIEIRAYHQGGRTVIEVRDDGRGLDYEAIRRRAVDRGLLSAEGATNASRARLIECIFEPGFSTAERVSDLSGRGVGLDVVREQLAALKGTVNVTSEPGSGTVFSLFIPLTLSVAKLLVCTAGGAAYALASDSIETILVPRGGQISETNGQRLLQYRRRLVPVRRLSELLPYNRPLPELEGRDALQSFPLPADWAKPLLLLRLKSQLLAVEIDQVVTEQELVIKPMGSTIAPPEYIYGCTILGDGSVVPVIDGAVLLARVLRTSGGEVPAVLQAAPAAPTRALPAPQMSQQTVLVVDDSQAIRQTLQLIFKNAGYRVLTARDGREALEQLRKHPAVRLVLCDIEMPNMNGFEFLDRRRKEPALAAIPVVMLTSRSGDKHRRMAAHLGANAFFTKPYIEPELLSAVSGLMSSASATAVLS